MKSPLIRPEAAALIFKAREIIAALALATIGLWLITLGGLILTPIGAATLALAAGWGLMAFRRIRFAQGGDAPGMVEVDEAQIGYLGPTSGGFVSIVELVELRLLTLRGRRLWRLKQADGQALLIPVDAAGADRLFDAFATLPGMDSGALVAALAPNHPSADQNGALTLAGETRTIWRRAGMGVVQSG